jgi:hypothetical protein
MKRKMKKMNMRSISKRHILAKILPKLKRDGSLPWCHDEVHYALFLKRTLLDKIKSKLILCPQISIISIKFLFDDNLCNIYGKTKQKTGEIDVE